VLIKFFK